LKQIDCAAAQHLPCTVTCMFDRSPRIQELGPRIGEGVRTIFRKELFMRYLILVAMLLTACARNGSSPEPGEAGPVSPKQPAFAPDVAQTVVIKNSVVGDIVQYVQPGLSIDLKMQCTLSNGTVYCNTLTVLP
jgi:hypothetical protein